MTGEGRIARRAGSKVFLRVKPLGGALHASWNGRGKVASGSAMVLAMVALYLLQATVAPTLEGPLTGQLASLAGWILVLAFLGPPRTPSGSISEPSIAGFSYVTTIMLAGGAILGLGWNPLSYSPVTYTVNLAWIVASIIGGEALRHHLLSIPWVSRRPLLWLTATTAFLTTITIPLVALPGLGGSTSVLVRRAPIAGALLISGAVGLSGGFQAGLVAGLLTRVPLFLLPILPNFGSPQSLGVVASGMLASTLSMLVLERAKGRADGPSLGLPPVWLIGLTVVFVLSGLAGVRAVVVTSGSMEPSIMTGDLVLTVPTRDGVEPGTVVLYKHEGGLILHRVVSAERSPDDGWTYTTQGDANSDPDPWPVGDESIVGRELVRVPRGGVPLLWVRGLIGGLVSHFQAWG